MTAIKNIKFRTIATLLFIGCTIQLQAQTQEPFVTTWKVGTNDLSITIPTRNNIYSYSYTVDWGDGTTDTTTYTDDATHTYSAAGTYTVAISGDFPAIYFNNFFPQAGDNSLKIETIKSWGTQRWLTLANAFQGCKNLTIIEDGAGVPDLTMVIDMSYMLSRANSFNSDLSNWDVSNVIYRDLSNWNISNVTDMEHIFADARSFTSNLSSWDVSQVTDMGAVFWNAHSFNSNLSSWNVSNVIDMFGAFSGASSFTSDLSNWDVSEVTIMVQMFRNANSFTSDLSNWDVSKCYQYVKYVFWCHQFY